MAYSKPVFLWKQAPFTRLLPALATGILVGYFFNPSPLFIGVGFATLVGALLLLAYQKAAVRYFALPFSGACWMLLIVFLGMMSTYFSDVRHHKNWYGHHTETTHLWKATIISKPEEKEKSYKAIADITAGYGEDSTPAKGKILLYFSKDSTTGELKQGDVLYMRNKLRRITSSGNPGSFDYRKYMEYRHIFYHLVFANYSIKRA